MSLPYRFSGGIVLILCENCASHRINWLGLHLGARRIFPKEVVAFPVPRRSNRSRDKPAAATGIDISQNAFDARIAEGALVRGYARLKRIGRQRLVAVLADRSEFKQGVLNVKLPICVINGFWNLFIPLEPFSPVSARVIPQ
jgi:hypothetical protein